MSLVKSVDRDLIKQWLAALRSGDYEQGQGVLRTTSNRYCCLGVLCEVLGVDWELREARKAYAAEGEVNYLPKSVAYKVDLDREYQRKLGALNDGTGSQLPLNFNAIADVIEQELL